MGLTHQEAARIEARLTPTIVVVEEKPGCKHGCPDVPCRHTRTEDKNKKHVGLGGRGVPIIGIGSGAISGTAPGGELGAAARLEQAGRDIVKASLNRNRFKREQA